MSDLPFDITAVGPAFILAPGLLFQLPDEPVMCVLDVDTTPCGRLAIHAQLPDGEVTVKILEPDLPVIFPLTAP